MSYLTPSLTLGTIGIPSTPASISISTLNTTLNTNASNLLTTTTTGSNLSYNNVYNTWVSEAPNLLKNLDYKIDFIFDDKNFSPNLLIENIKGIKKNKFIFNCDIYNNRIQPYELIMKLIENKTQFNVKVKISDVLTICYRNFMFTKIQNNLNFTNSECDFSIIKVKFDYDKILYENHKLSTKELRCDKLRRLDKYKEKINKNIE